MDSMYWLTLVSRVLHILGANVLLGGMFYQRAITAPAAPNAGSATPDDLFAGRGAAWARWVGVATLVLLVTGIFDYVCTIAVHEPMGVVYHVVFVVKCVLALVVFALAALMAGRTPAADRFRRNMTVWLGLCLAIGAMVVFLGGVLQSLPHLPAGNVVAPLLIQPSSGQPAS